MTVQLPDADERRRWFEDVFTQETFLVLSNLRRINLQSRRMLANALYNAIYKPVAQRQGEFARISDEDRARILDIVTLEIVAKVMTSIEDLGKVLISCDKPPKETPGILIASNTTDSLAVFQRLADAPRSELLRTLQYREPGSYGLRDDEAEVMAAYHEATADVIRRLLRHVAEFIPLHVDAHNKYRHGSAVAIGFVGAAPGEGFDRPVGVYTGHQDLHRGKFVLTGARVVSQLLALEKMVVDLADLLVERRLQLAEYGGIPFPMLCTAVPEGDGVKYETRTFKTLDRDLKARAEAIAVRVMTPMERTRVVLNLVVEISPDDLRDRVAFYTREWNPTEAN